MELSIIKSLLLKGEILEHIDENENEFFIWFSKKTKSFCIEKNAKCIGTFKTFESFKNKINGKGWSFA